MIYSCCDELRRAAVREHPTLNGIDFLEVVDRAAADPDDRQRVLKVHFVKPLGTLELDARRTSASKAASASRISRWSQTAPAPVRKPMSSP